MRPTWTARAQPKAKDDLEPEKAPESIISLTVVSGEDAQAISELFDAFVEDVLRRSHPHGVCDLSIVSQERLATIENAAAASTERALATLRLIRQPPRATATAAEPGPTDQQSTNGAVAAGPMPLREAVPVAPQNRFWGFVRRILRAIGLVRN